MNLLILVWKNIWKKPLASLLSIILFALGTTIILSISNAQESLKGSVKESVKGVDMILGANGSPLQLVLSSLFHIDFPTGNIPLEKTEKLLRNPLVKETLNISVGDNFEGFRIVGTEPEFITWQEATLESGGLWENSFEAVIGNRVAKDKGLKLGSEFHSSHGFSDEGMGHDHQHFKVVGILAPSGSLTDRLIFCSTQTVWQVHGKERANDSEITASLIRFRNPGGLVAFPRIIRKEPEFTVASPAFELNRLFLVFEPLMGFLKFLSWVIIGISALSIMFSLFNTLSERVYEISLMRVMGASRLKVFLSLILEGLYLSVLGFLIGDLFSRFISQVMVNWILPGFSSSQDLFYFSSFEISLFVLVMFMGIISALIPAVIGVRKEISSILFSE